MGVCKGVNYHTEQRNLNQNHNKKLLCIISEGY